MRLESEYPRIMDSVISRRMTAGSGCGSCGAALVEFVRNQDRDWQREVRVERMAYFYLVRHGQASFAAQNYDRLSSLGEQQARSLGEYYRASGVMFDAVLTGDMVRQADTGTAILAGQRARLRTDVQPNLNECDMHQLVDVYPRRFPDERPGHDASARVFFSLLKKAFKQWREGGLEQAHLPETWPRFKQRVADVMTYLRSHYATHDRVLVVSSGGVIAMWLCHLLRAADETMAEMNMQIRNASVSWGFFNDHAMRLAVFNELPHLNEIEHPDSVTYS